MTLHEIELLTAAVALGAKRVRGWSAQEEALVAGLAAAPRESLGEIRDQIAQGADPLGEGFCLARSPVQRRPRGATYTPAPIVAAMVDWARSRGPSDRVVDPGAGSGRFLVATGRAFPHAELIGVETDPLAAVLCRAHLAAAGLAERATVRVEDYRAVQLEALGEGRRTLFIGNPPYVRHHLIDEGWKEWLGAEAKRLGLKSSALAGLHVHFYVATASLAQPGDLVCYITAAEWLDVNYGRMLRDLLLNRLGLQHLVMIDPAAQPFPDAQTTAVIACMEPGAPRESIHVRQVARSSQLGDLSGGLAVSRDRLGSEARWTVLVRPPRQVRGGMVELGELFRVHRGQVTGANGVWIAGPHAAHLPASVLTPAITRARELYAAGGRLTSDRSLRCVIDLPQGLDEFSPEHRAAIEAFLRFARSQGAHETYIASHRNPWYRVGLREPAPILATYMARRPPAFVRNLCGARHLNIAHGLYPRQEMDDELLMKFVNYLSTHVALSEGRVYAGGLTKFEPREMERILVPEPRLLVLEDVA